MTQLGAFAVSTFEKAKVDVRRRRRSPARTAAPRPSPAVTRSRSRAARKNKARRAEFVKWATDEEAQTILAKAGIVPVRTDLVDEIYVSQDKR